MIESFGDSETEKIFSGKRSRKMPVDIQAVARRKLRMLHQARALQDLTSPPGNRLETLQGNLKGYWSIRINQQWRIIFRWDNASKHQVSIVDYH